MAGCHLVGKLVLPCGRDCALRKALFRNQKARRGQRRDGFTRVYAKRKTTDKADDSWKQWLSLASEETQDTNPVAQKINELSNKVLKTIMRERDEEVVDLCFDIQNLQTDWSSKPDCDKDAVKFLGVLSQMLQHEASDEIEELGRDYKAAAERMYSMIEDSGWRMVKSGADCDQEFVDDEIMQPPPSFNKY